MQFKLVSLLSVALAVTSAVASPAPIAARTEAGDCNTGPIQCCNSVEKADSPAATSILGLLGIVLEDINVLVGLSCSPISVIGGGSTCEATPVCCENNSVGSLISIGCIYIDIL